MANVCIGLKLYKSSNVLSYVAIRKKLMAMGNLWGYHSSYAAVFGSSLDVTILTGEYLQCSEGFFLVFSSGSNIYNPIRMLGPEYGDNMVIRNIVKYLPTGKACHSRRLEFPDELPLGRQNCEEAKPDTYIHLKLSNSLYIVPDITPCNNTQCYQHRNTCAYQRVIQCKGIWNSNCI
jgi:hypothetical protein